MSTLAHAAAAVNVRHFADSSLMPGSYARIHATGKPELYAAIQAEYERRGLDKPQVDVDGVSCDYEPSEADLALLHGDDHDAAPGDPEDFYAWTMTNDDYYQAEADFADWVAEMEEMTREAEGWPLCHA